MPNVLVSWYTLKYILILVLCSPPPSHRHIDRQTDRHPPHTHTQRTLLSVQRGSEGNILPCDLASRSLPESLLMLHMLHKHTENSHWLGTTGKCFPKPKFIVYDGLREEQFRYWSLYHPMEFGVREKFQHPTFTCFICFPDF